MILDICEEALQMLGTQVSKIWWDKEGLDLEWAWVEAVADDEGEPAEMEGEAERVAGN